MVLLVLHEDTGTGTELLMPCTAVPEQLCDTALINIIIPCGPLAQGL